ncbi:hypothetical protein AVEN_54561-1 [Araneus ventricosus]|uniref:Uncharacterized protein n=1 Tax=Araneus ventricosus TaxID=182803 RepID=A0A4Y2BKW3_ARAVE|nr:hypothetical protein AVEN_54561-1 [Araneus ventricosus]
MPITRGNKYLPLTCLLLGHNSKASASSQFFVILLAQNVLSRSRQTTSLNLQEGVMDPFEAVLNGPAGRSCLLPPSRLSYGIKIFF